MKDNILIAIAMFAVFTIIAMPYLFLMIVKPDYQEIECKEYKVETIVTFEDNIPDTTYVIKYK